MKRLFVAMPYGKRKAPLDYENPGKTVTIDFDSVWTDVLQPSVPDGFETRRADELRQSGLIDRLYIEWLFDADIVLADLTFGNPNVYYELGIRQVLSRKGTVLVACRGTKLPFDVRNQFVLEYDYFTAPKLRAFQSALSESITKASAQEVDSPVHVFLPGLSVRRYIDAPHPEIQVQQLIGQVKNLESRLASREAKDEEDRIHRRLDEADSPSQVLAIFKSISHLERLSAGLIERLGIRLRKFGYFDEAIHLLEKGLEQSPKDSVLLREVGFAYRKKGPDYYSEAESYMTRALEINDSDAELHGMLGGLLKRREAYGLAQMHYQLAHKHEPKNLYSLVNLGAISIVLGEKDTATTWYQQVNQLSGQLIKEGVADYWSYLCLGEASVVLGDRNAAITAYKSAIGANPPIEDLRSASEQLQFLSRNGFNIAITESVLQLLMEAMTNPKPK